MSRSTQQQVQTITNPYHELTWGKYRGKTIQELIENDPMYLQWAIKYVSHFDVDHKLEEAIKDAAEIWKP